MGLQIMESRSHCDGLQVKIIDGQGKGVFTIRSFKQNEKVLIFSGKYTRFSEIKDFTHYFQISPDTYLSPSGNFDDYVNHSCEPNCGVYFVNEEIILKTIRKIEAGEQLSFDYGTIMFNEPTRFKCACGSVNCRKNIGNFYSMEVETQDSYLSRNMVPLLTKFSREQLEI